MHMLVCGVHALCAGPSLGSLDDSSADSVGPVLVGEVAHRLRPRKRPGRQVPRPSRARARQRSWVLPSTATRSASRSSTARTVSCAGPTSSSTARRRRRGQAHSLDRREVRDDGRHACRAETALALLFGKPLTELTRIRRLPRYLAPILSRDQASKFVGPVQSRRLSIFLLSDVGYGSCVGA